jgi:DNA-directed RNA polymerase specialized sigma24 family protein
MYEDFAEPLFDYCAGLLGDQAAAASAVQDSVVDVDARVSELPGPGLLRVSLYCAARRRCLARRSGRRLGAAGTATAGQLDAVIPDVRAAGEQDETLLVATAALASLADRDREVLNLSFRHGLQAADLAAVLGLSPRRARSLLSRASARFRRSAAMVVVLRAGWLGCHVLARIAGQPDPAPPPLASKLGRRLECHLESCPACARTLGHQALGPGLISQVPLVAPVGQLRLRIVRTALARGSYRCQAGGFASGGIPAPPVKRRGVARAIVASSAALAALAALGVRLYRHESTPVASPPPIPAKVSLGSRSPADASRSRVRELPALGTLGLGVLPGLPPGRTGSSPSPDPPPGGAAPAPGPSHARLSSPKPANPSPTPVPTPVPDPVPPSPVA